MALGTGIHRKYPLLASQWHPVLNQPLLFTDIKPGSDKKIWWICEKSHEWESVAKTRFLRGHGCPYCSGRNPIPGETDLASTHPEIAEEWHPTLNKPLTPIQVKAGSNRKVWWKCEKSHEWESKIYARTKSGCPYCAGTKPIPEENTLNITHPYLLKEWDYTKNILPPNQTKAGSDKKVWWKCAVGHSWETTVYNRKTGKNCPYCANRKILPGFNDLATLYPSLTAEWHPTKNNKKPTEVSSQSRYRATWVCKKKHEWEAVVYSRTGNNPSNCPICSTVTSKFEKSLTAYIQTITPAKLTKNSRTIIPPHELDLYLPDLNLAIEFNGLYWHSENQGKHKNYHYNKWLKCKNQGIQLIQIWEDDWNEKPDIIKNIISSRLRNQFSLTLKQATIQQLTAKFQKENHNFLINHGLETLAFSDINYGLFTDNNQKQLQAVIIFKKVTQCEKLTLNLIAYISKNPNENEFTELLTQVEKTVKPYKIISYTDNTSTNENFYLTNNFTITQTIPPDYTYLIKGKRVHRNHVNNSPKTSFPRIWDAGKTKWVKTFN